MGTNYYFEENKCESCGKADHKLHIGKSSAGWTFVFSGTDLIKSWEEWERYLTRNKGRIVDEYGQELDLKNLKDIIFNRGDDLWNHAERHPEGNWVDDKGHAFIGTEFS